MSQDAFNLSWTPTPEELAAYADGEADRLLRDRIDVWLDHHPEGQAELDQYRDLSRAWRHTSPADPAHESWDAAFERIAGGLKRPAAPAGRRRFWLGLLGAALAAACVWGALLLRQGLVPPDQDDEPFPVVSASEVIIISMNPDDRAALPVGEPLDLPQVDLATHEEIELVRPPMPQIKLEDWSTPMIVDPHVVVSNR
jgi:hypothetical protein